MTEMDVSVTRQISDIRARGVVTKSLLYNFAFCFN